MLKLGTFVIKVLFVLGSLVIEIGNLFGRDNFCFRLSTLILMEDVLVGPLFIEDLNKILIWHCFYLFLFLKIFICDPCIVEGLIEYLNRSTWPLNLRIIIDNRLFRTYGQIPCLIIISGFHIISYEIFSNFFDFGQPLLYLFTASALVVQIKLF